MLKMMYKLSKDNNNIERYHPEMLLRTGLKVKNKLYLQIRRGCSEVHFIYVTNCGIS